MAALCHWPGPPSFDQGYATLEMEFILSNYQTAGTNQECAWGLSYGGNWYSNVPWDAYPYQDTQISDDSEERNFTIGMSTAFQLQPATINYWQTDLSGQAACYDPKDGNWFKINSQLGTRGRFSQPAEPLAVFPVATHSILLFEHHLTVPGFYEWTHCAYWSGGTCIG